LKGVEKKASYYQEDAEDPQKDAKTKKWTGVWRYRKKGEDLLGLRGEKKEDLPTSNSRVNDGSRGSLWEEAASKGAIVVH